MGVQLGYGVYTNSLGLISDGELLWRRWNLRDQRADMTAIHMFFDCLGIGVGLWASIAATWKPDGRYTFGYGRVETLSGFANGKSIVDDLYPLGGRANRCRALFDLDLDLYRFRRHPAHVSQLTAWM